jgi:putative addiction module component (TIGR02574 family)
MIAKDEIDQLSVVEKLQLVENIWDSLAVNPDDVPVPKAHQDELDRRWAEHQTDPGSALTLDEFNRRLARKL